MQNSRIYSFLDNESNMNIHFLEGQKIIHDMAILNNKHPKVFSFYRDTLLSTLMLSNFLKVGESLGLYIDNESPFWRYKLETGFNGNARFIFHGNDIDKVENLNGLCRLTKYMQGKNPYQTVIEMNDLRPDPLINEILEKSYQMESKIIISDKIDQSLMINQLPKFGNKDFPKLNEYILRKNKFFSETFAKKIGNVEDAVEYFEENAMSYLGSKEVSFFCGCSKDKMIENLLKLSNADPLSLLNKDGSLEIQCDYCQSKYKIVKNDLNFFN